MLVAIGLIVGWSGAFCLALGHLKVTRGGWTAFSLPYRIVNIVGAVAFVVSGALGVASSSVALNLFWIAVGLWSWVRKPYSLPPGTSGDEDIHGALEFRSQCLAMLDEIDRARRPVVITRNGQSAWEVRPHPVYGPEIAAIWRRGLNIEDRGALDQTGPGKGLRWGFKVNVTPQSLPGSPVHTIQ